MRTRLAPAYWRLTFTSKSVESVHTPSRAEREPRCLSTPKTDDLSAVLFPIKRFIFNNIEDLTLL